MGERGNDRQKGGGEGLPLPPLPPEDREFLRIVAPGVGGMLDRVESSPEIQEARYADARIAARAEETGELARQFTVATIDEIKKDPSYYKALCEELLERHNA